ncbi:MAG: peptidase U32 family protein, partial [Lachnospiraceae bacterium]
MSNYREQIRNAEILAPAGNYECFRAAINAGADAVYLGGSMFGARAFAGNFDEKELIEAIRTAHLYGRKVYLTVNTLLRGDELEGLADYIRPYYEAGLDAAIVQDYGVFAVLHKHFPELALHASTQMTITGRYGAQLLKNMGATRVVTARELSVAEIKNIHEHVDIEIESFVHGALCYSYSGQCLLSSMLGGRSGNRGRCAQPCRLTYSMNGIKNKHLLSPKDMCTIEAIPDIIDAGVYSLKIEGRMKGPEYVAGVVS